MRQYEPLELKKTSVCDLDDTIDNDVSLQKLDLADLSNVTPDSAKVNRRDKDEESQPTSASGPRGGIVVIRTCDFL